MSETQKKGFTLIELLLYISLTAVLLITLSIFLSTMISNRTKHQVISEVESSGAQIVSQISTSIRNAAAINNPLQFTNSSSLSLDMITVANNPTIFSAAGGVLTKQEGNAGAINLHSTRISTTNLSFTNMSRDNTPGNIKFTITLEYIGSGMTDVSYAKTFYGSASLR